jgi:clan AA aspartic protease (TIGR02281 family)
MRARNYLMALAVVLSACSGEPPAPPIAYSPPPPPPPAPAPQQSSGLKLERIALTSRGGGGTFRVGVGISGVCCFLFVLDSGASDVSVPPDMFRAMVSDGLITKADLIDVQTYQTASGEVEGLRFRMPVMQIGGLTVRNVVGSVSEGSALLLGQSFLKKFRFWAIDNAKHQLVLGY